MNTREEAQKANFFFGLFIVAGVLMLIGWALFLANGVVSLKEEEEEEPPPPGCTWVYIKKYAPDGITTIRMPSCPGPYGRTLPIVVTP